MLTLGILSGTSVDAIDLALVDWSTAQPPQLVAFEEYPWPSVLAEQLISLPTTPQLSLAEFGQLHTACGQAFAQAVQRFLKQHQLAPQTISVIGSHGQTIWHQPAGEQPFSLQIGHAAIIAKQTGIPVAADFRMDDIALGGQGAPLAPAFHAALLAHHAHPTGVLNLGGIANLSLLTPQQAVIGFDTGPANTLIDAWYRLHHPGHFYDAHGAWAASASVHQRLLMQLRAHPYFALPAPKSTGREDFSVDWLMTQLDGFTSLSAAQIHSTLVQLTVDSIAHSVHQYLPKGGTLWVAGGGVKNEELMRRLRQALPQHQLATTDQAGYPAAAIEAMLFAWLGKQRLLAHPIDLTTITGSRRAGILGGLWLPE